MTQVPHDPLQGSSKDQRPAPEGCLMATRQCEIDYCIEPASRGCWSCFRFECQPHRGTDPCACVQCLHDLERCGCLTGCSRCALDALAPPDEPGIPVPVRIGA
jgi:hypothetical protein